MEDMEDSTGPGAGGLWVSTIRVSGEPVRSNVVPLISGWAAELTRHLPAGELEGATLAMRQANHLVTTREGADLGTLTIDDFVEVVEYDPVRHVALVIGNGDAPRGVPVLWLMLRMFAGAEGACTFPQLDRGETRPLRTAPRGSFDEAFAVGEGMSTCGREAVLGPAMSRFERVGTVLVVPPRGDPATVLGLKD